MSTSRTHGVDSARRVLQILLEFSEDHPEARIEELAKAISVSLSTTYRYVSLLKELQLIEELQRGTYALSPRILKLARSVEASIDIVSVARPILHELTEATGETSLIIRQLGDSAVCVEISQTDQAVRLSLSPGHMVPLHRGAGPKVLLANMEETKILSYFDRVGVEMEERQRIRDEFDGIRSEKVGESLAEVDTGVWASASPIHFAGKVIAVVSVAVPEYRIDEEKRDTIIAMVKDAAVEISTLIDTH